MNKSELLQLALLDKLPQKSVQGDWGHFTAGQSQLFQVVRGRLKHKPRKLRQRLARKIIVLDRDTLELMKILNA